jgi:2-polyprenyl-3-methyl-5-hydroxy-6-metoxy-1,4-benzoquinol methylase
MPRKDLHEANRLAWNAATVAHNSHKADQAGFLREGGTTLFPEEVELLGDLAGRSLIHLQCNAGQDTLCLARLGATVTGVDISDEAIAFARQFSADTGIPATFARADVYDWLAEAAQQPARYDVVFSSYGALVWLSDIRAWARGIASILKPGGRLVVVEFHPFAMTFEWDWSHKHPYFAEGTPLSYEHGVGDYVAMAGEALAPSGYLEGTTDFVNPHPGHEFQWGIGEVVSAILDAGLTLTALREYPYSNAAKLFDRMRELPGKRMVPPEDVPNLPLMYGLAARRD